jgi:hypothetical protein
MPSVFGVFLPVNTPWKTGLSGRLGIARLRCEPRLSGMCCFRQDDQRGAGLLLDQKPPSPDTYVLRYQ